MNTHWKEEELIPYLDGRLDEENRQPLEAHLRECAPCRAQLAETRALLGVLDEWNAAEASPGFEAVLRSRLAAEKLAPARWFSLRPAYAAAFVLVVVLAVGISLWQPESPEIVRTPASTPPGTPGATLQTAEDEELAVMENRVLLENYELLEEFDVLFEPLSNGEKKL